MPCLFFTDPSKAPWSVPFSNARANSYFPPIRSIPGPIMRVSAFFVEESGGLVSFGRKETGKVQLFAYINVKRVCDKRDTFTPLYGGMQGVPGSLS